jgi:hypothetical protein
VLLTVTAIGVAGCAGPGTAQPATTRSAGTGSGGTGLAGGGPAGGSPCVVGAWRSDGYTVDTPNARATGGGGFTMAISPDGRSLVDFAGMRPVTITVTVGGNSIDSHVVYTGKVAGRLKLPPPGTSTGTWESEPGVDWGTVRITLDVHGTKVLDNASLAEVAGNAGAAAGANTQPVLGSGTYTCARDKLTIAQRTGSLSATWALHREA